MRKLRVFVAEVVCVGVLFVWLGWKYPELVDPIVRWVALVVCLHATWEFVLEPFLNAIRLTKQVPTEVRWILGLPILFVVSVVYLHFIDGGLVLLAKAHEKWENDHRPVLLQSPAKVPKPTISACDQLRARDKEIVSRLQQKLRTLRDIENSYEINSRTTAPPAASGLYEQYRKAQNDFWDDPDNVTLFNDGDQLMMCELKRNKQVVNPGQKWFSDRKLEYMNFNLNIITLKKLLKFPEYSLGFPHD